MESHFRNKTKGKVGNQINKYYLFYKQKIIRFSISFMENVTLHIILTCGSTFRGSYKTITLFPHTNLNRIIWKLHGAFFLWSWPKL